MKEIDLKRTINIAIQYHGNQKYGDLPFIVHPMLVARHFDDYSRKTISILHDILEDTDIEIQDLIWLYDKKIVDAIEAITKRNNETYNDYINRVSLNNLAMDVKIADLEENLHSCKSYYNEDYKHLIDRYEKALIFLKSKQ